MENFSVGLVNLVVKLQFGVSNFTHFPGVQDGKHK